MRKQSLSGFIILLCAVGLQAAQHPDPSQGITLSNSYVRLEFEPGGMGLSALVDLHSGVNHVQPVKEKHLLWEIALGSGTLIRKVNNNYAPCNYAVVERLPGGTQRAVMEWNDLRWWKEDRVLTVRATVDLPPDSGIAKWRISVDNKSDYWGLWSVAYPDVTGFPEAGKYDLARTANSTGGALFRAWSGKIQARNPSGDLPMQFLALSRNHDSVYLATMDASGYAKDFVVDSGEKNISIVHYAEDMGVAGSDYPGYYPVEFGVYQGGWVEAAQHYRVWALQQKWAQAGTLSQRADFPEILKNLGVWILEADWTAGGTGGFSPQMDARLLQAQKTLGVPVGVHWYNWHHMRFDNEYPHFLPPKPGFAELVKELVNNGVLVMPYINGLSADLNIPDFDKFAPHAIVDEAGGYRLHFYGEASGRLLSMCPTQEYWQNAVSTLVQSLVEDYGVNGVYIDQIASMEHELCFSGTHGHPVGGGHYWVDGNRELLAKVRNLSTRNGRRPVITSEGTNEVFLDLVDGYLTDLPTDREIPLMEVVYSGYVIFFASPSDFTRNDRSFAHAQGQALIDGRQNGWMSVDLFKPEYSTKAEYLGQCGRLRVATKPYLVYGRLLCPVEPERPVPTYTEEGSGPEHKDRYTGPLPAAEGRLWQDANGHLAVFLANYIDQPVEFKYRINPAEYGLAGRRFELKEITAGGSIPISTVTGTVERSETLGPRRLKVIEIALPAGPSARLGANQ
jgi:hypothetical protein